MGERPEVDPSPFANGSNPHHLLLCVRNQRERVCPGASGSTRDGPEPQTEPYGPLPGLQRPDGPAGVTNPHVHAAVHGRLSGGKPVVLRPQGGAQDVWTILRMRRYSHGGREMDGTHQTFSLPKSKNISILSHLLLFFYLNSSSRLMVSVLR